jgi:hypothetical protein
MRCEKERNTIDVPMRESTAMKAHMEKVQRIRGNSQLKCLDESRHGSHEWPRHIKSWT